MKFRTALSAATAMPTARAQTAPLNTKNPATSDEHADDQVDPAPGGEVELEDPFLADDVEVVVEQGDQALQGVERADHDHGNAGEDDETDGQAAARPFIGGRGHTQPLLL